MLFSNRRNLLVLTPLFIYLFEQSSGFECLTVDGAKCLGFTYKDTTYDAGICPFDPDLQKYWCPTQVDKMNKNYPTAIGFCEDDINCFLFKDKVTVPSTANDNTSTVTKGLRCKGENNNCCTETNPCQEGDGDCDEHNQCAGDLVCGNNNCGSKVGTLMFEQIDDCCQVNRGVWTDWNRTDGCAQGYPGQNDKEGFYYIKRRWCVSPNNVTNNKPYHCGPGRSKKFIYCQPVNGTWSNWTLANDTECKLNQTTNQWMKSKTRTCNNPAPKFGGKDCQPDPETNFGANGFEVCSPVHGEWSSWTISDDSNCKLNQTLNEWTKSKTRECNDPEPKFNGKDCQPDPRTAFASNGAEVCQPVNGGWSQWTEEADSTCIQLRNNYWGKIKRRTCDNPVPKFKGLNCSPPSALETQCTPVDGGWGDYGSFGPCQSSCTRFKFKHCTNPAPKFGGAECSGNNYAMEACVFGKCPGQGCLGFQTGYQNHFMKISLEEADGYKKCKIECQLNTKCSRFTIVFPNENGQNQEGCYLEPESNDLKDYPELDLISGPKYCPIDGSWSEFGPWSECSKDCEGGEQSRRRHCNNPEPQHGGADCQGLDFEIQDCNIQECPKFDTDYIDQRK